MPKDLKYDDSGEQNSLEILRNFVNFKSEEMTGVRRHNADLSTSRKRLELQINSLQKRIRQLEDNEKRALAAGRADLAAEASESIKSDREMLDRWTRQYTEVSDAEADSYRTSQLLQRAVDDLRFSMQAFMTSSSAKFSRQEIRQKPVGRSDMPIEAAAKLAMMNELLPEGIRPTPSYSAISILLQEGHLE
jgi:phage shock protein A